MADDREHHHEEAVPQHRGVEGQMHGLAWLLQVLDRPKHQRAIDRCRIEPPVAEQAPAAALPAGGEGTVLWQGLLPVAKTDGQPQQQPCDYSAQQHQVALVAGGAVLTQEADQLTMEPGLEILEGIGLV